MRKLTSYTLPTLKRGDHVFYKGQQWRLCGHGYYRVFLQSLDDGTMHVATTAEIRAYTEGLADAARSFAAEMRKHEVLKRSRLYTSRYFPPAPRTPYDL